jgi:hypothetical protein
MPTNSAKADPGEVRAFFVASGFSHVKGNIANGIFVVTDAPATPDAMSAREIMDMKKADGPGYDQIARGIKDGSLTY